MLFGEVDLELVDLPKHSSMCTQRLNVHEQVF